MSETPKPMTLRKSSAWLHTWLGLFFGWLLFLVFVTGTLSVFRDELDVWLQPEFSQATAADDTTAVLHAVTFLQQQSPASQWNITLPGRSPVIELRWFKPGERAGKRGGERAELNPATGELIAPRETRLADFLYRLHFELYSMPRNWARWIVGIATAAMFLALVTGIIIHKKIFLDFFTFRPQKGQRSWMDIHVVCSVLALPFHLMITFSGLLLIMYLLMPWGVQAAYDGDMRKYFESSGGRGGGRVEAQLLPTSDKLQQASSVKEHLSELVSVAQQRWPMGIDNIRVSDPLGQPSFSLRQRGADSLLNRGRSEGLEYQVDPSQLQLLPASTQSSTARQIYNIFTALHLVRFADPVLRWTLFWSGVAGSLMVASGLILWTNKRQGRYSKDQRLPLHLRIVNGLNLGAIIGLLIAMAVAFGANRLLPVGMDNRLDVEIQCFFIAWALSFCHGQYRNGWGYGPRRGWLEQLIVAAGLYALLGLAGIGSTVLGLLFGAPLPATVYLVTDGLMLLLSAGLFLTWRWMRLHPPKVKSVRRVRPERDALATTSAVKSSTASAKQSVAS